jgi:hypothetical protein
MANDIVGRAAYNNALWCDAVCATHQGAGEFHERLWINRRGVPRYYPDVVTLAGPGAASAQTETIAALAGANPGRVWAVKDSYQSLDLHEHGFTPLFDAQWIWAKPGARAPSRGWQWRGVDAQADLLSWEQCRSEDPTPERSRLFLPPLLSNPDIRFVFAADDGAVFGGGILNRGAGVAGLSNVFAAGADPRAIWDGLAHCAHSAFPGLPIVAYERSEETLDAAYRAGFAPAGPLRIWRKPPAGRN